MPKNMKRLALNKTVNLEHVGGKCLHENVNLFNKLKQNFVQSLSSINS